MRFDFDVIPSGTNPQKAILILQEIVKNLTADDPPYLTDILIRRESEGGKVLEMLAHADAHAVRVNKKRMLWPIEVLRDEWGNVPPPGFTVYHKIPVNNYRGDGEPIPNEIRNVAIASGQYEEQFYEKIGYEVDEKGCIWCPFESAGHFLNVWGIHRKMRSPVMYQIKPEHSVDTAPAPNGQQLHVWYWRYAEVPIEEYTGMDKRSSGDGGARGRKS